MGCGYAVNYWVISMKQIWSFYEKIIDWKKVEELADVTDDKT